MSIEPTRIVITSTVEVEKTIVNALRNSTVPFRTGKIKDNIYYIDILSNSIAHFSVLLHILSENKDAIEGSIEIPNVGSYDLTDEGREELRKTLTKAMNREITTAVPYQTKEPSFFEIYREEIGEIIKEVPSMLKYWQKEGTKLKRNLTLGLWFILASILISVGVLTYHGMVSGEALTFLVGTFIGYIFAFLQKYLGITSQ